MQHDNQLVNKISIKDFWFILCERECKLYKTVLVIL